MGPACWFRLGKMCRVRAWHWASVRMGLGDRACGQWNPKGNFRRGGQEDRHSLAPRGGQGIGHADGTPGPESLSDLSMVTLQLSGLGCWD